MRGLGLLGLVGLLMAQGCVVAAVGVVAGAAAGVTYTALGVAERTFNEEYDTVAAALQKTIANMDIKTGDIRKTEENNKVITTEIEGFAGDLTIHMSIERITDKVTRVAVDASKRFFIKDKATATQILIQTGNNLPKSSS